MHPEDIKASLRKVGSSPAAISRSRRVSKMAVSHVIHGNSKSARIATAIAEALNVPVSKIWPGKYPALEIIEARGLTAEKITADLAARQTRTRRKAVTA